MSLKLLNLDHLETIARARRADFDKAEPFPHVVIEDLMPSELSGGMLKRAALARAVVMDPQLLFCDEPSAGLDPVVAAAIDDLILRLRDALRITIIIVTHELESAFKIADRIAVLDKGEILIVGTVDEVRACEDSRVQNLLNRRVEEEELDPEAYLRRLTGARNQ